MARTACFLVGLLLVGTSGLCAQRPGATAPPPRAPAGATRPPAAAAGASTAADRNRALNQQLEARARRGHVDRRTGAPLGGAAKAPAAPAGPRRYTPEERRDRTAEFRTLVEEDFVRITSQRLTADVWLLDESRGTVGRRELDVTMLLEGGTLRHRIVLSHRDGAKVVVDEDYVVSEVRGGRPSVWRRTGSGEAFLVEARGLQAPLGDTGLWLDDVVVFDPRRFTLQVTGEVWRDGELAFDVEARGGAGLRHRRLHFDPATRLPTQWQVEEGGKVVAEAVASQPRSRDGVRAFERVRVQRGSRLIVLETSRREVNRGIDPTVFAPPGVARP